MTTTAQLRKAALALPETEEGTHFGKVSFSVRGKGFASVTEDGHVQLHLSDSDAEQALSRHPSGERLVRMGTPFGVRIPLDDVNGKDLNELVEQAWASRAPERLVSARRQAKTAEPPAGPDALPRAIGRPATRALLVEGISSLGAVAACTRGELLALHGVGPKAVRILDEALTERGLSFRDEGDARS